MANLGHGPAGSEPPLGHVVKARGIGSSGSLPAICPRQGPEPAANLGCGEGGCTSRYQSILAVAMTIGIPLLVCLALSGNSSADIVADHDMMFVNATMELRENITVLSGATVTIINSSLAFLCGEPMEYGIHVRTGGHLEIVDNDQDPATVADESVVSGLAPFFFVVDDGADLRIRNSRVSSCGPPATGYMWSPGGIVVGRGGLLLENVRFDASGTGVFLNGTVGARLVQCSFVDMDCGLRAWLASDTVIKGCTFEGLVRGVATMPWDSPGAMTVEDCRFDRIEREALCAVNARNITVEGCTFAHLTDIAISIEGLQQGGTSTGGACITNSSFEVVRWGLVVDSLEGLRVANNTFRNFGTAIAFWDQSSSQDIAIEGNHMSLGGTGIELSNTVARVEIQNGTFFMVELGIRVGGRGVRIHDNRFIEIRGTGVEHTYDGMVEVYLNTFENCTVGAKASRYVTFRPSLSLSGNLFVRNDVGVMARDAARIVLEENSWSGCGKGVMLLGPGETTLQGLEVSDCEVGIELLAFTGRLSDVGLIRCSTGVVADLVSDAVLEDFTFVDCLRDLVAANYSKCVLIDSLHGDRFLAMDDQSSIEVRWTVTVNLIMASDSRPATELRCELRPKDRPTILSQMSDTEGNIGPLALTQQVVRSMGRDVFVPYTVDVHWAGCFRACAIAAEVAHLFLIVVDDVPPSIEVIEPRDGASLNRSVLQVHLEVREAHSGLSSIVVMMDLTMVPPGSLSTAGWDAMVVVTDGQHRIDVMVVDRWGNACTARTGFSVDTTPPEIIVTSPINGTLTNTTSCFISGFVLNGSSLNVQGESVELGDDGAFEVWAVLEDEGANLVTLSGIDELMNRKLSILTIIRDTVPPDMVIDGLPPMTNSPLTLICGWTDGIEVRMDGTAVPLDADGHFSANCLLAAGDNRFALSARDRAGNHVSREVRITLDTELSFAIDTPANGDTVELAEVLVRGVAEPGLRFRPKDGTDAEWRTINSSGVISLLLRLPTFGTNTFVFELSDEAGNSGEYAYQLNRIGRPSPRIEEPYLDPVALSIILACGVAAIAFSVLTVMRRRMGG